MIITMKDGDSLVIEGKNVFEYNVFGSKTQTIGKFVQQTKLGEWS